MRETARRAALLAATTVRVSPGRALSALLEPAGRILRILQGLWIAVMVNAAAGHHDRQLIVAAALLVGSVIGLHLALMAGNTARIALVERVGFAFDRQIADITAAIPSIEHLDRAEFADELQILAKNRGVLGNAVDSVIRAGNSLATVAATLIIAGTVEPRLLLLALTGLPALIGGRYRYRWAREAEQAAAPAGRLADHLRDLCTDPDAGMELRILGLRTEIHRRHTTALGQSRRPIAHAARRAALLSLAEDLTFAAAVIAILTWLVLDAISGHIAPGTLVLAIYLARTLQQTVAESVNAGSTVATSLRAAGRLLWLRDRAAAIAANYPGTLPPPAVLRHGIDLHHVSFTYPGTDTPALDDITVSLPAGSAVAIVGDNGAGKSTLVQLLTGLHHPSSGQIHVDGTSLTDLDITAWRQRCTAAFQDTARFEFTLQHAVGIGDLPRINDRRAVAHALHNAGATRLRDTLPADLATQLGTTWEHGTDPSCGQWQQIALARAIIRPTPLLLILDEPTTNLDAPTEHALFQRLTDTARTARGHGAITLLITHRLATARAADTILVIDHGHITEQGTHTELINAHGHYAELYELQARTYR